MLSGMIIVVTGVENVCLVPAIFFNDSSELVEPIIGNSNEWFSCAKPFKAFFDQNCSDASFPILRFYIECTDFVVII